MTSVMGLSVFQALVSAGAGLVGIGIGIGVFKITIKRLIDDVERIKYRQARLRGEDNEGIPIFMTKRGCEFMRERCEKDIGERNEDTNHLLERHSRDIDRLTNFARYMMQKDGLSISEINKILDSSS